MNYKMKHKKRGSVLVFTLFIMFITLIITFGIALSSVIETKSTISTKNSSLAFQVADTGIEVASIKLKGLDPLVNDIDDVCDDSGDISSCSSGKCTGNGIDFELYFYDSDRNELSCSDVVDDIDIIKSVGKYENTLRAVEIDLKK